MSPKEKAEQLVDKFLPMTRGEIYHGMMTNSREDAKECALICVDEIIPILMDADLDSSYWDKIKEELILI